MDIKSLSFEELLKLKTELDAEISKREHEEKAKARKQIIELAKTFNLSVEEVMGKHTTRKPVEVKYRNPENPDQTWTGRGRTPVWVAELVSAGKTLEDLAV